MPTRKQRRRRQKERRHDYEYVYVDEEGNELEVDADEATAERAASRNGRAKPRAHAGPKVQAPSWRRVGKRGLVFAPLMFITVMLLDPKLAWWQWAVMTVQLLALFLPLSYFIDALMYRRHMRRMGGDAKAARAAKRPP